MNCKLAIMQEFKKLKKLKPDSKRIKHDKVFELLVKSMSSHVMKEAF